MQTNAIKSRKPIALHMAVKVRELKVKGNFDEVTQTWSNRKFDQLAAKKHCEAR